MQLYDTIIDDIKVIHNQHAVAGNLKRVNFSNTHSWPSAGDRNLVLQSDTAIELGNPADEAVAFSLWTETPGMVKDNCITLIGPDITASAAPRIVFGKIVLIEGSGFDGENAYDRYREMDLVRFDLSLKGYMMRAANQNMREWSRISKEAVDNGFSFSVLGSALIAEFKKIDYIKSVEVIFITSTAKDVAALRPMAEQVWKINSAMSKMSDEMSSDCTDCEFEEVCDEVTELRKMRKTKEKGRHLDA
jgi:CO dehydrogenase/acetyl-CoA synthase beta subunit